MIAIYSINIRIMGKENLSILGKETIFKIFGDTQVSSFIVEIIICVIVILFLNWFFKTQLGLAIRAIGDNEQMMCSQGANTNLKKFYR